MSEWPSTSRPPSRGGGSAIGNLRPVPPPPPEALVLRFPPGGADEITKVRKEAKWANRAHQKAGGVGTWYRLSVWVDAPLPGESEDDLKLRLIRAAGLAGLRIEDVRNSVFWTTKVRELQARAFVFRKDENPGRGSGALLG